CTETSSVPYSTLSLHDALPISHVVVQPVGLERRVESADEPRVLRRHTGRAGVRVALLRLDAPDGQHRLTRHLDHVDTQGEGDECVLRQAELAAADEGDAVGEPGAGEGPVDPGEGETEGESDRIAEDEGSRAGPPFAAVHGDEVHAPLAVGHRRREVLPEVDVADRRLDTDREAR